MDPLEAALAAFLSTSPILKSTSNQSIEIKEKLENLPALEDKPKPPTKTNRCHASGCRVKLSLTSFPCHCNHSFCPKHRYPEEHECTHDYKKQQKDELLKTMSTAIVAEKLAKV